MKKIPTLFERDWNGDRSRVLNQVHAGCEWVIEGKGHPTRKIDGTSCLIDKGGMFFKRREVRDGGQIPAGFVQADQDGAKLIGWVPVGDGPEDKAHREAHERWVKTFGEDRRGHTFELVGPKVQGNPEGYKQHVLISHDSATLDLFAKFGEVPVEFDALRDWLSKKDIEGVVWHHPDGRMAKIKKRDFGLKRNRDA